MKLAVVVRPFWLKVVLAISFSLFVFSLILLFGCSPDVSSLERTNGAHKRSIYVITATYHRPEQMAELTRLAQTLALDGGIHWIVIEDANSTSSQVAALLTRMTKYFIDTTHLFALTPAKEKLNTKEPRWRKVRGVHQRNTGLSWIRIQSELLSVVPPAVVYFADDDNTYDVRIFDKMRAIKEIGVWPVGLVGKVLYEGPVCDKSLTHVLRWRTNYRPDRFCACDMAGFAVSLSLLLKHNQIYFSNRPGIGMLEADFLTRLVYLEKTPPPQSERLLRLEPIVCDEILVWHTRTLPSDLSAEATVNSIIPAVLTV